MVIVEYIPMEYTECFQNLMYHQKGDLKINWKYRIKYCVYEIIIWIICTNEEQWIIFE